MLNNGINTLISGKPNRWDEFLNQTLFSIRVRTHAVELLPILIQYKLFKTLSTQDLT
jgi:hypothetical protein